MNKEMVEKQDREVVALRVQVGIIGELKKGE